MKHLFLLASLFLMSCEAKLSDEQRKKMRERMEAEELKRVPEATLTEAAFERGRGLVRILEEKDPLLQNATLLDSLQNAYQCKILFLQPGDSAAASVERQIIDAYVAGSGKVELQDNVQKLGSDSLLYTKPILNTLADGSVEFTRAFGIRLSRKGVVLSIKD